MCCEVDSHSTPVFDCLTWNRKCHSLSWPVTRKPSELFCQYVFIFRAAASGQWSLHTQKTLKSGHSAKIAATTYQSRPPVLTDLRVSEPGASTGSRMEHPAKHVLSLRNGRDFGIPTTTISEFCNVNQQLRSCASRRLRGSTSPTVPVKETTRRE